MDKEYIVCSCINYNGIKVGGRNMRNCLEAIIALVPNADGKVMTNNQGFITSTGRFVTREEAWDIAKDADQIKYEVLKDFGNMKPFLMSINLFKD